MHYRIVDWESFEHGTKNKRPSGPMTWFAHPTNLNSRGRLRLLRKGSAGWLAIVVFEGLVALHGQRPRQGRTGDLVGTDQGPLTVRDIADAIRMDENLVSDALEVLASEEISWLRTVDGPVMVQEGSECGPQMVPTGQDRTLQEPPNPPRGAEGSAGAGKEDGKAEPGEIPAEVLDAFDAARTGKMPAARRPADSATVRRWQKLDRPSADEIADRTRRAASSAKFANPDRGDPLTIHALLAPGTWAAVGALQEPQVKPPEQDGIARARAALGDADRLWREGSLTADHRALAVARAHPATEDEAAHLASMLEVNQA